MRSRNETVGGKTMTQKKVTKPESQVDLYIIHGWTYTVEPWKNTLALLMKNGLNVKMLHVPGLTEPSKKSLRSKIMLDGRTGRSRMERLRSGIRMAGEFC